MKVYVKKEDKNSLIPGIIITILFLSISVDVFIYFFGSGKSIFDSIKSIGSIMVFAVIFFLLSIYFIVYLIKPSKGYKAKLMSKEKSYYNGKTITYMTFRTGEDYKDEAKYSEYKCYTIGDNNNLNLGSEYILKVKEFNWQPRYVEEYYGSPMEEKKESYFSFRNIMIVFFGLQAILGILGIIFYPKYLIAYIINIAFCAAAIIFLYKSSKKNYDNNNDDDE